MRKRIIKKILAQSGEQSYYKENNWTEKSLNVEMEDMTHDGIADYIVTMIMLPPTVDAKEDDISKLLEEGGEGYVQVFDGREKFDPANPSKSRPIWEEGFAAARPGNIQISLVKKDGLAYLLLSDISSYFGVYNFWYQVVWLDEKGKENVIDSANVTFDTYDHVKNEQMPINAAQKQQIAEFKVQISKWFEDAVLLAGVGDVSLVTTPARRYAPEEFYDTVWKNIDIFAG